MILLNWMSVSNGYTGSHFDGRRNKFALARTRSSIIQCDLSKNKENGELKTARCRALPDHHIDEGQQGGLDSVRNSRRRALQTITVASVALPSVPAFAGVAEYDMSTGELYSPKGEMLRGGSVAARGTKSTDRRRQRLKPGQALQSVYETRFIAYLARFLLTFDPSASAWWLKTSSPETAEETFAEFAESVEFGLADYFVGPYGSYSSLQAMTAGIEASVQAKSTRANDRRGFFDSFRNTILDKSENESQTRDRNKIAKAGVLNLYTLLKARYTSTDAKKQLAILFSFFAQPQIQPTTEIRALFGEIDNASIAGIDVIKPISNAEATSRSSSRRGGGYALDKFPVVRVAPPPALGSSYKPAQVEPKMGPTSRVLRIRLLDRGAGYTQAPTVTISNRSERQCLACAIMDREGHIESIVVLDPGYGYVGTKPPKVNISGPGKGGSSSEKSRPARAVADLEYEVIGVEVLEGGNGFASTEPPKIFITAPQEDPDWYVENKELATLQSEFGPFRAEVVRMKDQRGSSAFDVVSSFRPSPPKISLDRIKKEPLELLPSTVRPELNSYGSYVIPAIASIQTYNTSPNPRYRAVDPLFGAIGKVPVTKSAAELKPDEYGRLAVSGAVCTILVRTALNPLELIKTKQQLQNDEELNQFTLENLKKSKEANGETPETASGPTEEAKIGSLDLIQNLMALRGPLALFQSADITFLASLMFGSFGFSATELFRRSFTATFFSGDGGDEIVLLFAAGAATIITSAVAAPFELLRVRSMGLVESKGWTEVLGDFIKEKAANGSNSNSRKNATTTDEEASEFRLKDIQAKDLLPLFAGFPPTATRELTFAIPKFLAFDVLAKTFAGAINSNAGPGSLPVQVGVGTEGLLISAISGALAGVAGAFISHPADLILTYTSASKKNNNEDGTGDAGADWRVVVKDLLQKEGGIANLYAGLQPRLVFFFLVIGLQFFLYDYVKILLQVGSDDLSLVLDVFYAVREGLV